MTDFDRGADAILLVGAGGIGAPAAWALAEAGASKLVLVDDDVVELGNLHRQVFFEDRDVGQSKVEALAAALRREFPRLELSVIEGRALPHSVLQLVAGAGVVIDATDNFPSRFLLSDATFFAKVPIVHAAAVRFHATVFACSATGRPCYRCLFEDIPTGTAIDCATAGVLGPVCGVAGAIAADRALRVLAGDTSVYGNIVTYEGLSDRLREVSVALRGDCELCGRDPNIVRIELGRYTNPTTCD